MYRLIKIWRSYEEYLHLRVRGMVLIFAFCLKALEELPKNENTDDLEDLSPDVELPIYQQRDNYFT